MEDQEVMLVIREIVEKYIDVDAQYLTSYERGDVLDLLDAMEDCYIN